MKAAVRSRYGSPDVLIVKDVDPSALKAKQVLARLHATTVNRSNYHVLTGNTFIMRFFTGLFSPSLCALGWFKFRI